MYIPAPFEITDPNVIRSFLLEHPFGTLAINGDDGIPVVSHLPFLLSGEGGQLFLEGHLAKANGQEAYLAGGRMAKMIVSGAHGYVSSSVYGHLNVPTYNYQAVHVTGTIGLLTEEELLAHLKAVVGNFERDREHPIGFDSWPGEMIERFMREISGFRITVLKTEAAFKLSQNRNAADFGRIVDDLEKGNTDQARLAGEMKKIRPI